MTEWHGGKGSRPRAVDTKKFSENWDRIFKKKEEFENVLDAYNEERLVSKYDKKHAQDQHFEKSVDKVKKM